MYPGCPNFPHLVLRKCDALHHTESWAKGFVVEMICFTISKRDRWGSMQCIFASKDWGESDMDRRGTFINLKTKWVVPLGPVWRPMSVTVCADNTFQCNIFKQDPRAKLQHNYCGPWGDSSILRWVDFRPCLSAPPLSLWIFAGLNRSHSTSQNALYSLYSVRMDCRLETWLANEDLTFPLLEHKMKKFRVEL